MLLQPNTIFDNHYTLIRQLGRGGFSEVWLAHDSYMDIDVAIKIYAPGQGMDPNSIDEFRREITGVFQLNHPNLLCPKHLGIWEKMPYLIMAYCPAGSCVKHVGNMTEEEIWHLIHDVAAGLAYLHEKDIVHQDIKPDNILIDTEGNYLITDFGISTRARSTLRKSVIGGNTSGGTTAYMGPERFSRQPAPTKASDIWSFGAMAFELLEGVTPFGEIGGGMQKGGAEIPFINAPVSDALKFTIFKMISKETWDRPTAATLVEWANNPSSIEVDYSLLSEEGNVAQPQPAPDPVVETPVQPEGRATQRFGSSKSIDNNATVTISSIQSEPLTLSVEPRELAIPAIGGQTVVSVNTNGEWILPSSTQQWMQISKQSDDSFIINCEPNVTGKQRESKLFITAVKTSESLCVNINVYQLALKKKKTWLYLTCITIVAMLLAWIALISPKTYEIIGYTPSEAIVKSLKMKGKTELATALHHRDYGDIYAQASVEGGMIYEGEPFILQVKKVGSYHIHYNVKGAEYIPDEAPDVLWIEDIYTPNYSDSYDVRYMPITNSSSVVISFYIEVNKDEKVELDSYTFNIKKRPISKELHNRLIGIHKLRLQWLEPKTSTINIEYKNGVYYGKSEIIRDNDYLYIDGTFEITDANNIYFTGEIREKVSYLNNGQECLRNGTYHFKAYNGRQYWRMQEMANCEGNGVVDYIDIFF